MALKSFALSISNVLNVPKCQKITEILNCVDKHPTENICFKCKDNYYVDKNKQSCIQNPDDSS